MSFQHQLHHNLVQPCLPAMPGINSHAQAQAQTAPLGGVPAQPAPAAASSAGPDAKRRREEAMAFDEAALTSTSGV